MNLEGFEFSEMATKDMPNVTKEDIFKKFKTGIGAFGLDNLMNGYYRINGWEFDCTGFLTKFLYKDYQGWNEVYAPSKKWVKEYFSEINDEDDEYCIEVREY